MGGEWHVWTFWNEEKRNKFFWKDMPSQLQCRLLPQYCNVMCLPTQTFTLCNVHVNTLSSTKETAPLELLNIWVSVLPVTQHLSSDVHRLGSSPSVQKKRDNAASIKMRISCLHLPVSFGVIHLMGCSSSYSRRHIHDMPWRFSARD